MPDRDPRGSLDRRGLLRAALAWLVLAGASSGPRPDPPLRDRLRAALPSAGRADHLARACAAALAGADTGTQQAAGLAARLGRDARRLTPVALRRRIARTCARDFAAGRTRRVDGWLLAETEVRIYAALA